MRKLNFVFLAGLVAVITVLGVGVHFLHAFQLEKNASALLVRADRAEADKDLEKVEQSLGQYVNLRRDDAPAWKKYAQVVEQRDPDHLTRNRERVFLLYEEALRHNAGDRELERKCADLALDLERFNDAQRHLTALLKTLPRDSQGQPAAASVAELEDLQGQCERGLNHFENAKKLFESSLVHDPTRLSCYARLAELHRVDLGQNELADATIQEMVAKNPNSGLARVRRWSYVQQFLTDNKDFTDKNDIETARKLAAAGDVEAKLKLVLKLAAASDVEEALKLAPNEPEVLLAAAGASRLKKDSASERTYLEKGFKLDPKNINLALALSALETREGHVDEATAVLRQADQAKPSLDLAFILAEILIDQDKIEGKDQAAAYMTRLEKAGHADTLVRFLDVKILVRQEKWDEAIPRIEIARAVLRARPAFTAPLNLMLAECYRRVGDEEQRFDALRRAAESARAPDTTRAGFADALVRSGQLDKAVTFVRPLAEQNPQWRLDLVRLLIQQLRRQPRDQRDWQVVERELIAAEKTLPEAGESLTLLRVDLLVAQDRPQDASKQLSAALSKDPRNLAYRLTLARLTQRRGQGTAALAILDQAEKDLGPSLDVQLARLDYWSLEGGAAAKAAVAKLAETRQQIPAADRPAFLSMIALAEERLGEVNLGRKYSRELAALQPENLDVRLKLFALALAAKDYSDAGSLVDEIRKIEGDEGTTWQFAQASMLLDKVRRGSRENLREARDLALRISKRRPTWANGFALNGELAELDGSTDQAIEHYLHAVELGTVQPRHVRSLVELLHEKKRFDEIDHVAQLLRDQGAALDEIKIVNAIDAIRAQDFDQGIKLAREVYPDASTSYSDHLNLGRFYFAAGLRNEAGKEFQRAVELGPAVPESWITYVKYLVQAQQIDRARVAVEDAKKALPADRASLTLAQCFLSLGDTKSAEDLIGKAMTDEGKSADPDALRLATIVFLGQNRHEKVEEYLHAFDRIAELSPADKAWVNRTRVAILLSKNRTAEWDEALKRIDQNLSSDPRSIEDLALKATILAVRPAGHAKAITILEGLATRNRLDDNQRFLLAQLYLGEGDEDHYRGEMQKLLNLKVKNPRHLSHFTNYWIGRKQLDQADRWLAELKKAEPRGRAALDSEARLLDLRKRKPELLALIEAHKQQFPGEIGFVADLLNRYGFAKEAEASYKSMIASDPKKPDGHLALAVFLARHDRAADAIEILKQAWSLFPSERVAAAALALYDSPSANEAQRRQVENWCVEASRRKPDAVGLTVKLGAIWIRQGRYDEAEAISRRVLSSDPENVEALNNLAWLLSLGEGSKTNEALELIDRAIDLRGPIATLVDTRAVALIRAGQIGAAVKALKEAQARAPANPSLARHLAWALQAEGKTEEARKAFQEAEKLGWKPGNTDPRERSFMNTLRQELNL